MANPLMAHSGGNPLVTRSTVVKEGYPIKFKTLPEPVKEAIQRTAKKVRDNLTVAPNDGFPSHTKITYHCSPYIKKTYHCPYSVLNIIDRKSKPGKYLFLELISNTVGDASICVDWEKGSRLKIICTQFSNVGSELNNALQATILALNKDIFYLPKNNGKNLSSVRFNEKKIRQMAKEILEKNKCSKQANEVMAKSLKEGGDLVDCVLERKKTARTKTISALVK